MENMTVRLESLDIHNFKNVKFGRLSFENPRKYFASSVLGLYGQNGSGKTAVIDSITLLKLAFSGPLYVMTVTSVSWTLILAMFF